MVEHNHDETIAFLKWHSPTGLWTLTAISPARGGGTDTCQFDAETEDDCRTWLERQHAAQNNVYFMMNPPIGHLTKKAKKEHVKELAWLHVDLDAKGEGDQSAALKAILDKLNGFYPPPSAAVMSGGGFQAFWRLKEAVFLGGDLDACAEVEAYNIQLSNVLGGDHCHNVDRIMRLPGTVNYPDAAKLRRGRVPVLAGLAGELTDRVWDLSEFRAAQREERQSAPASGSGLPATLPVITDLDQLGPNVSDRIRALIVVGHDPTDPKKYKSRSEPVWAVVCELVRAGVSDDLIAAVLLDKSFGISAHILDQRRPAEYAARQIGQAREEAVHPELAQMNNDHAVLLHGKVRILSWEKSEFGREQADLQTVADFRVRYQNRNIKIVVYNKRTKQDEEKSLKLAEVWLGSRYRREYKGLRFMPGSEREVDGYLNLWRGWGVQPTPGDWSKTRAHIRDVICGGNQEHYEYLKKWMARAVQYPAQPAGVAFVMRGKRGTGKGLFATALTRIFGQHGLQINSTRMLTGQFNKPLRDCALLFADEAAVHADARGVINGLITESTILIEGKGENQVPSPNYLKIVMASNDRWIVPAGDGERRYFVVDVDPSRVGQKEYFSALVKEMDGGGLGAMLHDLLHESLGDWRPGDDIPKTEALNDQQIGSLDPAGQIRYALLEAGMLPPVGSRPFSPFHRRKIANSLPANEAYADDLSREGCRRYRTSPLPAARGASAWAGSPRSHARPRACSRGHGIRTASRRYLA